MKSKRGKNKIRFNGTSVAVLLAVLVVVGGLIYLKDTVRMYAGRIFSGGADELLYAGYTGSRYEGFAGGLAVASTRGIQVIDKDGNQTLLDSFEMGSPAVTSGGDMAIAYDIGGDIAKVFSESDVVYEIETSEPIISASVNNNGWSALCTDQDGYNGHVSVYDNTGKLMFEWFSGEAYVTCADISDNNKDIAVAAAGSAGGQIVFFEVESEDEKGRYQLADDVIIDMRFESRSKVAAVTDARLVTVKTDGSLSSEYSFGGKYLRNFDLGPSDTHLVVLSDYQVGGMCTAVTVKNGKERGKAENVSGADRVSIRGSRFAVLSGRNVTVYSVSGKEKGFFENVQGTDYITVNENGYVIAAGSYSAKVLK